MDIQMFGKISDVSWRRGPSGFEEDVIRTIAGYCKEFELSNDAMNNLYARMPGASAGASGHSAGCTYRMNAVSWCRDIQDNGCLGILMLGGFPVPSLPVSFCMGQDKNRKNGSWNHLAQNRFIL